MDYKGYFENSAKEWTGIRALRYSGKHMFNVRKKYLENNLKLKGKVILDMGCGTGEMVDNIAKYNEIIGFDFIHEFLKKWPHKGVRADMHKLPFKDYVFDAAISVGLIQYSEDLYEHFSEVKRVLKKNGLLYMSTLNKGFVFNHYMKLKGKESIEQKFSKPKMEKMLKKHGFTVVKSGYLPVLPNKSLQNLDVFFRNMLLSQDFYILATAGFK